MNQDVGEYNRAMLLLKNIDNQLSMKNNPEDKVEKIKKETITISNRNATTTYDAPDINNNIDQNTLMNGSNNTNSKGCNDKHCHSCDTAVVESDYDEEYVLSSKNNYQDYYFNDSDEDKNTSNTKLSHSNHDTHNNNHNNKQLNSSAHNHHNCSNSKHNHSHNPKTNAKVLGILADERV